MLYQLSYTPKRDTAHIRLARPTGQGGGAQIPSTSASVQRAAPWRIALTGA